MTTALTTYINSLPQTEGFNGHMIERTFTQRVNGKKLEVTKHGVTLLRKKEFGIAHGIKGAELHRKHREYIRTAGAQLNGPAAAALASGQYLVTGVSPMSQGFRLTVVEKQSVAAPAPKATPSKVEKAIALLSAKHGIDADLLKALLKNSSQQA